VTSKRPLTDNIILAAMDHQWRDPQNISLLVGGGVRDRTMVRLWREGKVERVRYGVRYFVYRRNKGER
jgi:hypothetical protein